MKRANHILLIFIIALAIITRLVLFMQARDLFIDEANVARNIYEKNYIELASVLDYEQFAPPLFLFLTKASVQVFGFSETALRLIPFLSSILSVLLLVYVAHLFGAKKQVFYPLALFAGGILFLRYGTELKQYSGDFMVTLALLALAIKTEQKLGQWKNTLMWLLFGSLALWFSMPAVFILFTIGGFWLYHIWLKKEPKLLLHLFLISGFWLAQFGLYFYLILQHQISSEYLQNYHEASFLFFPKNAENILQNLRLISGLITQAGGHTILAIIFNCSLLLIGSIYLILKDRSKSILLLLPIGLLLLASLLHKYALVARLTLFIQPILFLLIAYGVYCLFSVKNWWLKVLLLFYMAINVYNHQHFDILFNAFEIQEIHYGLDLLEQQENSNPIWVQNGAVPAFKFYTEMSPKAEKYGTLLTKSTHLKWDVDYKQLALPLDSGAKATILFSNYFQSDVDKLLEQLGEANLRLIIEKPGCLLYEFQQP